jgi:hypothetical protein
MFRRIILTLCVLRMTVPTMDRMWSSPWVGMPVAIYLS